MEGKIGSYWGLSELFSQLFWPEKGLFLAQKGRIMVFLTGSQNLT